MSTVHTEVLTMHLGDHISKSYLAYPAGQESPQPGVLVIPEFWGLTEHTKGRAHQLAELGYCSLALDVYGEGWVGSTAEEAATRMNALYSDMDTTSERMMAYLEALKDLKQADATKTASIGYCLGGALSLHLARMGADVTGVASFHGSLDPRTIIKPGSVKAKVLVCHGEADSMIPSEKVQNFKKEMDVAGVDYKFIGYPKAQHGFTNPQATENGLKFNIPTAYNKEADIASWNELLSFFKQIFS